MKQQKLKPLLEKFEFVSLLSFVNEAGDGKLKKKLSTYENNFQWFFKSESMIDFFSICLCWSGTMFKTNFFVQRTITIQLYWHNGFVIVDRMYSNGGNAMAKWPEQKYKSTQSQRAEIGSDEGKNKATQKH